MNRIEFIQAGIEAIKAGLYDRIVKDDVDIYRRKNTIYIRIRLANKKIIDKSLNL